MKIPGFLSRIGAQVSAISAVRTSSESGDSPPPPGEPPVTELDDMLRETEQLCQMIFNSSNDAILVSYPPEGRFVDVNPKACTMLGYTREELLATPLSAIHPHDLPRLGAFAESVLDCGTGWTNELSCVTKSGVSLPTEISASCMEISGKLCIIALVRDISERKQAEDKLLQQMRELAVLEERNRLARELHDSITQSLYTLTLFAEAGLRTASSGDPQKGVHYLERVGETSQQALKEMRLLVYGLRPSDLATVGIVGALTRRLDAVERRAGVEARLIFEETLSLPARIEGDLYRAALEALNNSLKHAGASSLTVRIGINDGAVELAVEDNGKGFEMSGVGESGGMGLGNMGERAERLGGSLTIVSAPGKGTKIEITVPLNGPESKAGPASRTSP